MDKIQDYTTNRKCSCWEVRNSNNYQRK